MVSEPKLPGDEVLTHLRAALERDPSIRSTLGRRRISAFPDVEMLVLELVPAGASLTVKVAIEDEIYAWLEVETQNQLFRDEFSLPSQLSTLIDVARATLAGRVRVEHSLLRRRPPHLRVMGPVINWRLDHVKG